MKLIRAIVRPEREADVMQSLESEGFYAMTKIPVLGRGNQRGVQVGAVTYDELSKLMLLIVVPNGDLERAVRAIEEGAHTGRPGDGKILIQNVRQAYTVRTGMEDV